MAIAKLSPKYQIVIPREIRESLDLKPGEKIQIFQYGDRLEFIPVRKMKEMRGFLEGIDTSVDREGDRV